MRAHAKDAALAFIAIAIGALVIFLALVGCIFLVLPHDAPQTTTCDNITTDNGRPVCSVYMKNAGENIIIERGQ